MRLAGFAVVAATWLVAGALGAISRAQRSALMDFFIATGGLSPPGHYWTNRSDRRSLFRSWCIHVHALGGGGGGSVCGFLLVCVYVCGVCVGCVWGVCVRWLSGECEVVGYRPCAPCVVAVCGAQVWLGQEFHGAVRGPQHSW
jgi:hypothetical protein